MTAPDVVLLGAPHPELAAVARQLERWGLPAGRWSIGAGDGRCGETQPLAWENDRLLHWLDASWACPLPAPHPLALEPLLDAAGPRSARVLRRCHRPGGWFWADARLGALLPYWEAVIGRRLPAVLVVCGPAAGVRALRSEGLDVQEALDLWQVTLRSAIEALDGREVLVVPLGQDADESPTLGAELASWLGAQSSQPELADAPSSVEESGGRDDLAVGESAADLAALVAGWSGPSKIRADELPPLDRALVDRLSLRRDRERPVWERAIRADARPATLLRRGLSVVPGRVRW
ncbi:MAG: hypothetical protein AAGA99_03340 [Actinomycetota bacterium]